MAIGRDIKDFVQTFLATRKQLDDAEWRKKYYEVEAERLRAKTQSDADAKASEREANKVFDDMFGPKPQSGTGTSDAGTPTAGEGSDAVASYSGPEIPGNIKAIIDEHVPEGDRQFAYKMASGESQFVPTAVSKTGATGLFQFTKGTGRDHGLIGSNFDRRADPVANTKAFVALTNANRAALRKSLGREPDHGDLAVAHQQGAAGARALLTGKGSVDPRNLALQAGNPKNADDIKRYYGYGSKPAQAPVQTRTRQIAPDLPRNRTADAGQIEGQETQEAQYGDSAEDTMTEDTAMYEAPEPEMDVSSFEAPEMDLTMFANTGGPVRQLYDENGRLLIPVDDEGFIPSFRKRTRGVEESSTAWSSSGAEPERATVTPALRRGNVRELPPEADAPSSAEFTGINPGRGANPGGPMANLSQGYRAGTGEGPYPTPQDQPQGYSAGTGEGPNPTVYDDGRRNVPLPPRRPAVMDEPAPTARKPAPRPETPSDITVRPKSAVPADKTMAPGQWTDKDGYRYQDDVGDNGNPTRLIDGPKGSVSRGYYPEVGAAIDGGLKFITKAFGFDKPASTAVGPDPQRAKGVEAFTRGEGALTAPEYKTLEDTVDPERKLRPEERNAEILRRVREHGKVTGDMEAADQLAGSVMLKQRNDVKAAGFMAEEALKNGDTVAAMRILAKGYAKIPDGARLDIREDGENGYIFQQVHGNKVLAEGRVTPEVLQQQIALAKSGQAYDQSVIAMAAKSKQVANLEQRGPKTAVDANSGPTTVSGGAGTDTLDGNGAKAAPRSLNYDTVEKQPVFDSRKMSTLSEDAQNIVRKRFKTEILEPYLQRRKAWEAEQKAEIKRLDDHARNDRRVKDQIEAEGRRSKEQIEAEERRTGRLTPPTPKETAELVPNDDEGFDKTMTAIPDPSKAKIGPDGKLVHTPFATHEEAKKGLGKSYSKIKQLTAEIKHYTGLSSELAGDAVLSLISPNVKHKVTEDKSGNIIVELPDNGGTIKVPKSLVPRIDGLRNEMKKLDDAAKKTADAAASSKSTFNRAVEGGVKSLKELLTAPVGQERKTTMGNKSMKKMFEEQRRAVEE